MPETPLLFQGSAYFRDLSCSTLAIPNSSVSDASVSSGAAVSASKLKHKHQPVYSQVGTMAAATEVIHVARGAGTIAGFRCGSITTCTGDATATVDLKKNGTTVLSAVVTLDNANTAYTYEAGTVSSPSYTAGQVFTVVVTANAGTGALGTVLFVVPEFVEDYQ